MGANLTHDLRITPKVHVLVIIMHQNVCAVPGFHSNLLLSGRWRVSIDVNVTTISFSQKMKIGKNHTQSI